MSRLYCYNEISVIVMPGKANPEAFPIGRNAWGFINPDDYGYRG